jgi:predicted short-subunit dehydrogenase-like oxidoreductase (DUF2520 family)
MKLETAMHLLIFGAGRVSASFAAYARHLGAEVSIATRTNAENDPDEVRALVTAADVVAAAIPDDRLADWFGVWGPIIRPKTAIHFSGALTFDGMRSYHPLYSFPRKALSPAVMAKVPFAREEGAPPLATVLPGAKNPEFAVAADDRAYYHALAVLSGNFAAHIWNETAKAFGGRFQLPPETILGGYLAGVVDRFRENPLDSMTGPVARRDAQTVAANLGALDGDPHLKALYESFLASAWPAWREAAKNRS